MGFCTWKEDMLSGQFLKRGSKPDNDGGFSPSDSSGVRGEIFHLREGLGLLGLRLGCIHQFPSFS